MDNTLSVAEFMGGNSVVGSPQSDFDFIEILRKGLNPLVISSVVRASSLSEEMIFKSLRIPARTAARRKAKSEPFKTSESESIYRFSRVLVTAQEVLGSKENAKQWVLTKNTALNGERPIDLLDTGIGSEDVIDVLHRIEQGVYS